MSIPKRDAYVDEKPTPADLAGIPVCIDEDNAPIRVRGRRHGISQHRR